MEGIGAGAIKVIFNRAFNACNQSKKIFLEDIHRLFFKKSSKVGQKRGRDKREESQKVGEGRKEREKQ